MVVAGHGRGASSVEADPAVIALAAAYLDRAGGDLSLALYAAVRDGLYAARSLSLGFVRYGRPRRVRL